MLQHMRRCAACWPGAAALVTSACRATRRTRAARASRLRELPALSAAAGAGLPQTSRAVISRQRQKSQAPAAAVGSRGASPANVCGLDARTSLYQAFMPRKLSVTLTTRCSPSAPAARHAGMAAAANSQLEAALALCCLHAAARRPAAACGVSAWVECASRPCPHPYHMVGYQALWKAGAPPYLSATSGVSVHRAAPLLMVNSLAHSSGNGPLGSGQVSASWKTLPAPIATACGGMRLWPPCTGSAAARTDQLLQGSMCAAWARHNPTTVPCHSWLAAQERRGEQRGAGCCRGLLTALITLKQTSR